MENPEKILMDLNVFEKNPVVPIPSSLEDYLEFISKTGNTVFPWPKVKPLFKSKLETTITEFNETLPCEPGVTKMPNVESFKYTEMKERMFEQLDSYSGVPFTVQRLCELLTQPTRHYKRVDKFMRGLEKVMLVVSTIEPGTGNPTTNTPLSERNGSINSGTGASPLLPAALGLLSPMVNGVCGGANKSEPRGVSEHSSPSKRMRLASEEEGGPCDSLQNSPGPSTSSSSSTGEAAMEIDTECTSSMATKVKEVSEGGKAGEMDDSGDVSTSDASDVKIDGEVKMTTESDVESEDAVISNSSNIVSESPELSEKRKSMTEDGCSSSEDTEPKSVTSESDSGEVEKCEAESSQASGVGEVQLESVTVTEVEDKVAEQVDSSEVVLQGAESIGNSMESSVAADSSDSASSSSPSIVAPIPVAAALEPRDEILPAEAESKDEAIKSEEPTSCTEGKSPEDAEVATSSGTEAAESESVDSSQSKLSEDSEATAPDQSDIQATSTPE